MASGTSESFRFRRRIFLVGPSGSGKSVIAKKLAPLLDYDLVDTDNAVLEKSGCITITAIFDSLGESQFRTMESAVVHELLAADRKVVVATGGGLPAIAGMMNILKSHGLTVYLKAEVGTLWTRLTPNELKDRPLLHKKGPDHLRELLRAREPVYSAADVTLRTDSLSADEVCAALRGIMCEELGGSKT